MVSVEPDYESVIKPWFLETAPAAILKYIQMEDMPDRANYLMNQQGLFSGKTEGDLDSVPGYYGGTASYKFVQNARAMNQTRVQRHLKSLRQEERAVERILPSLTPSEARVNAYKQAQRFRSAKPLKGPTRGVALKESAPGLREAMNLVVAKKDLKKAKTAFVKDENGNLVYRPQQAAAEAAAAPPPGYVRDPALVRVPNQNRVNAEGVIEVAGV
jgi:hypothetical protein